MKMQKAGKSWGGSKSANNVTNNYNSIKNDLDKNFNAGISSSSGYSSSYKNYSSANYGSSRNSYASESSSSSISKSSATEHTEKEIMPDSNSKLEFFQRDETDSLFQIISKAYQRNLNLVLFKRMEKQKNKNK